MVAAVNMGFSDFETLIRLLHFTSSALIEYKQEILHASLLAFIGLVGMLIPPYSKVNFHVKTIASLHLLPIILTSTILYQRGGLGTNALPDYNNIISFVIIWGIKNNVNNNYIARKPVTIMPSENSIIDNIVVIVDESIRGDYLDLNSSTGVKTNFPPDKYINFGIASSTANCSDSSNVSLRYGATRSNHLNDINTNPSIWSYAKKAGFSTIYIDGQEADGKLVNMMSEVELADINHFIQLNENIVPAKRDVLLANKLKNKLLSPGKKFIYINKMGAHFPYEGKYPPDQVIYKPTMTQSYFGNKIDAGADLAKKPKLENMNERILSINSYRNAIHWNVTHFFDILLTNLNLDKTLIIYTSDHGQDFHEDGRLGWRTHCRTHNASWNEGIVPFVTLTSNNELKNKLKRASKINYNNVSLFNLFPSLLELLGYSIPDIKKSGHVENSIFTKLPSGNQQFISYFFTRFGKEAIHNSK